MHALHDHPCLTSCPPKVAAITLDEVTSCIRINNELCTLCGNCITACDQDRTGCLRVASDESGVVGIDIRIACDYCDGNPSCVISCPEDVLRTMPKQGDGKWFAYKSSYVAPYVYDTVFGEWYKYLEE